jgi:hypothetical protein
MARRASVVADELAAHARGLNQYLGRIERLFGERRIPQADVHRAYAGALLSFYVDLERAIENIFMGLLMRRLEVSRRAVRPLVVINSEVVARKVVRGERRYVDWLPYQLTRDRAEAFLASGEPFASVTDQQALPFERVRVVRNALAHGGEHAMRRFRTMFTDGVALPPEQRRPAGFLRGQHAVGQTRFENLLAESLLVVRRLSR